MLQLPLAEIARLVGGRLEGDPHRTIQGVAPVESAGPTDLSFVANPRYFSYVEGTSAAALLAPEAAELDAPEHLALIRVPDPHAALARLLPVLYPEVPPAAGVHETAVIEPGVHLGGGVSVGPYTVIGRDARVGDGCRIGAHTVIGANSTLGAECRIHPQVTLYPNVTLGDRCIVHSGARLGADGFGYVWENGAHQKVPQVGGCRLGDDVEVGANTAIDRGSIGDTVIGAGTKIDNLVHISHNCRIGEHVIIVAQVGIAGSTNVGNGAVFGGQAGVGGHLSIGAGARVAGQAGVIGDVAAGETVSGYPARPHREAMRASAALFRLPALMRRIRKLERMLSSTRSDPES